MSANKYITYLCIYMITTLKLISLKGKEDVNKTESIVKSQVTNQKKIEAMKKLRTISINSLQRIPS